jgi:anhydro-N-acetylmuramic acid kinase
MDIALGGQGAPIVPIGEKLLFPQNKFFLNLGGIANLSFHDHSGSDNVLAFDVCPANRVLNLLAADAGKVYDDGGEIARSGSANFDLLAKLNGLAYYKKSFPKSLANDFGTQTVYPLIKQHGLEINDELATYVEHICCQITDSIQNAYSNNGQEAGGKLMITGGGALNTFLVERLEEMLKDQKIEIVLPETAIINYKEALIMGLIGVLRWREENNVFASVTGSTKDSIGGAVWIGQDA